MKSMGDRAFREKVDTGKAKQKQAERDSKRREELIANAGPAAKRAKTASNAMGARDILSAADLMEGMEYIPRTAETRDTYELILSAVHDAMGGEQPQDVIRDATDFVIVTLKDENLKDFDKKKEIASAIPGISTETFTTLVNLGKKITDFGAEEGEGTKDPDQEKADQRIDDDVGVAVVFEDEEEDEQDRLGDEEEDENAAFEVREESDDEDAVNAQADGGADASGGAANGGNADDAEDAEIIIGNEASTSTSTSRTKKESDIIPARDIDGFWLQRLISQSYPDPHETAEKTTSAMTILSADSSLRDCENMLMELFDYENFELVKILLKNREKIVWCTKLARSDDNQRMDVEVAMREKGAGWILKELATAAAAQAANGKNGAAGDEDMQVSAPAEVAAIPKTNIQAGSLVQPKGTVDLDSMMFGQGARLMSNKKCRLPEGSFKRSKKGYEEIHIPAPEKKAAKPGDEMPITELPEWTRAAFGKAPSLNRVQTRVYPVAFGEDDPILLCAPTGAGKVSHW